jgi:hypothetical protein
MGVAEMIVDHRMLTIILALWMLFHHTCTAHGHETHFTEVAEQVVAGSLVGSEFWTKDGKTYIIYKDGDFKHAELHVKEVDHGKMFETGNSPEPGDEDAYIWSR